MMDCVAQSRYMQTNNMLVRYKTTDTGGEDRAGPPQGDTGHLARLA